MEQDDKTTIQLQFRSGDDLFNNYNIGIIRQVVDKSQATIDQKKEELRHLVGGKYLDMLKVSETISDMNDEFKTICSSVDTVLTLCNELGEDYVYIKESDVNESDTDVITQELLWEEYDKNQMLKLAKDIALFQKNQNDELSSLNADYFTEFPIMASQKCIELLCSDPQATEEKQIELIVSFFLFQLFTNPKATPYSLLDVFLSSSSEFLSSSFSSSSSSSLQSLLQLITNIYFLIYSIIVLMQAEDTYSIFTSNLPQFTSNWREEDHHAICSLLKQWLETQLTLVQESAHHLISDIQTISSLAETKREIVTLFNSIQKNWNHCLQLIYMQSKEDPIQGLFTSLFKEKSQNLICSCFEEMCKQMKIQVAHLSDVSIMYVNEEVNKLVLSPIRQLFVDLSDLNYSQSKDLIHIVEEQTKRLFIVIHDSFDECVNQNNENLLLSAYSYYVIQEAATSIATSCHIDLQHIIETYIASFQSNTEQWLSIMLHSEDRIQAYFSSLKWNMRDADWYVAISGWKEYVLNTSFGDDDDDNTEEEEEEEKVLVPGACSNCLLQILISLCELMDKMNQISTNTHFIQAISKIFLIKAYSSITLTYKDMITQLFETYSMISSPGLLLLVFDFLFFERIIDATPDIPEIQENKPIIEELKEKVLEEVDPVDWTLAETYMYMALDEAISGVAVLISPILANSYELKNAVTTKSLTKNANIIFTPIEKLASYPISSQSIQLILQSRLKEKEIK